MVGGILHHCLTSRHCAARHSNPPSSFIRDGGIDVVLVLRCTDSGACADDESKEVDDALYCVLPLSLALSSKADKRLTFSFPIHTPSSPANIQVSCSRPSITSPPSWPDLRLPRLIMPAATWPERILHEWWEIFQDILLHQVVACNNSSRISPRHAHRLQPCSHGRRVPARSRCGMHGRRCT